MTQSCKRQPGPRLHPGKYFAVRKLRSYLTSSASAVKVKNGVQFQLFWSLCVSKKNNAVLLLSYCGPAQSAVELHTETELPRVQKGGRPCWLGAPPRWRSRRTGQLVCFVPYGSTQGDISAARSLQPFCPAMFSLAEGKLRHDAPQKACSEKGDMKLKTGQKP